jgi:hypothetical protein
MRRIILSAVACTAVPTFAHYPKQCKIKKKLTINIENMHRHIALYLQTAADRLKQ